MLRIELEVFGGNSPIRRGPFDLPRRSTGNELLSRLEAEGDMPRKYGDGEGFSEFIVFVNGTNVMVGSLLDAELAEGDRVVVLPALAGG
jgi:molybdopterin converting factor small subunit